MEGNGPDPRTSPTAPEGVLAGDTHTPKARLGQLTEPLDLHVVGPSGPLIVQPAVPSADMVPAQAAVDEAWRHGGAEAPTSVTVEFGTLDGHPYWLVKFDGMCLVGTQPSQPPGSTPRPTPSCTTTITALIDAVTGRFGVSV